MITPWIEPVMLGTASYITHLQV